MVVLSEDAFFGFVDAQPWFACICHHGPAVKCARAFVAVQDVGANQDSWAWATIDLAQAPKIATMFGLSGTEPHLLIMRDRIVLFCALLPATLEATRAAVDGAAQLDMQQVRSEIAQEQASRKWLFARRVCPTAWRTRSPD